MIKLNSSFEGRFVDFYDSYFLSGDKVSNEIKYILDSCRDYLTGHEACLDVGCGTGAYSEMMAGHFKSVVGIDISQDMIEHAENNHKRSNTEYVHKDARCMQNVMGEAGADLAISLAHVIGYQLDANSLRRFLDTVSLNVKKGGLFWFNFYNQPALFLNRLTPRHMEIIDKDSEIHRISNATVNSDLNCLDLDYFYVITKDGNTELIEIHEKMRYYTALELEYSLMNSGFEVIKFFNYNTKDSLTKDNWNGGVIARKIR